MQSRSLYVLLSYPIFLTGALPIRGFCQRLGGSFKATAKSSGKVLNLLCFDEEIYRKTFIEAIQRSKLSIEIIPLDTRISDKPHLKTAVLKFD